LLAGEVTRALGERRLVQGSSSPSTLVISYGVGRKTFLTTGLSRSGTTLRIPGSGSWSRSAPKSNGSWRR